MGEKNKNYMGEMRIQAGIEKSEQNCSRISNERKHPLEPSVQVCVCVCVCVCERERERERENNAVESSAKVT